MKNKISKLVIAKIKETTSWMTGREAFLRNDMNFLDKAISLRSLHGLKAAASSLRTMGTYYGRLGISRIIMQDQRGWNDLAKATAYQFLGIKIDFKSFFNTRILRMHQEMPSLTNYVSLASCLLCHAIVTEQTSQQAHIAELLSEAISTPDAINDGFFRSRHFEPFSLLLYYKSVGIQPSDQLQQSDLGLYQGIFNNWDDRDRIHEDLLDLSDYHCLQMDDDGGDWNPEFTNPPFDLLPTEILAIIAVRRRMGFDPGELSHPLLGTGLQYGPSDVWNVYDDVILRVEEAFAEVF